MTTTEILHTAFEGEVQSRGLISARNNLFTVASDNGHLTVSKIRVHQRHPVAQQYHTERSFKNDKQAAINYATKQLDDKARYHRIEIEKLEDKRKKLVKGD